MAESKKKKTTTKHKKFDGLSVPVDVTKKMIKENKVYDHKVKTLKAVIEPNTFMWVIKFDKGGMIPKGCEGKFTSEGEALKAIAMYEKRPGVSTVKVA